MLCIFTSNLMMDKAMRVILILGAMILGFTACSNKKTVNPNPVVRDNIIHLSTAIKNVREEMMLSELVDSVRYIPLETNPRCCYNYSGYRSAFPCLGIYRKEDLTPLTDASVPYW